MSEDRADVAEADEDGRGGDEGNEINSMGNRRGQGEMDRVEKFNKLLALAEENKHVNQWV